MFIEYVREGRSTRDKELLHSKVRAHAARWAYQKSLLAPRNVQGTKHAARQAATQDQDATTPSVRGDHVPFRSKNIVGKPADRWRRRLNSPEQVISPHEYWQFNQDMLNAVVTAPQSYPVHLDGNRLRAIEYFPELWSRWAADVIPHRADRQAATDLAVTSIVQRCLTDELHMIAFISYVLQRAPTVKVSNIFLLQTAGKALSELRSRIEGGNASLEEVVWPIIFLAHYELFGSKSVGAGRAHLKAVVELGGMEYLDDVTKVYIRRMDRGWWSDYPSIFATSNSPKPRWERLVPLVSDAAGSGFFDHADILGSDLTNLLPFVVDSVRAGVFCKESVLCGSEDEVKQNKVIRKCQSLMDTLREWLPAEPERMACIYPAMIWLQYTTWVMRDLATKASSSVDAYRNVTSHAHHNLLKCVQQSSQAHEMLLWAAVVGIATSADEVARIQYASRALRLARSLEVVDLTGSWKKYIWFEACAIIDYRLICAAFDEAVRQAPLLACEHWEAMRRVLMHGLEYDA